MHRRRILPRASSDSPRIGVFITETSPLSGVSRHPRSESRVVLPLPEGPITRVRLAGLKSSDTPSSARTLAAPVPYPIPTSLTLSMDTHPVATALGTGFLLFTRETLSPVRPTPLF